MNTKFIKIIALICALLMLTVCLIACEIEVNDDTEGSKKTEAKTEEITETEVTTESQTETKTEATEKKEETKETEEATKEKQDENIYTIIVIDENGTPVANVPVQICKGDICLIPVPTNAEGFVEKKIDSDISEYTVKIPDPRYVTEEYYTFPEDSKVLTITVKSAQ